MANPMKTKIDAPVGALEPDELMGLQAKPIIPWIGGKRRLVGEILVTGLLVGCDCSAALVGRGC